MKTLSSFHSGFSGGSGSSAVTSSAAPAIAPAAERAISAGSSTSAPRATLIKIRGRLHQRELSRANHLALSPEFPAPPAPPSPPAAALRPASAQEIRVPRSAFRRGPSCVTAQTRIAEQARHPAPPRARSRRSRRTAARLPAQLARTHRLRPLHNSCCAQWLCSLVSKTSGNRRARAISVPTMCSAIGMLCMPLALVTTTPLSRSSGYINCATAGGRRMNPFQFARHRELLGTKRKADENIACPGVRGQDFRNFGRCTTLISGQRLRIRFDMSSGGLHSENECRTQMTQLGFRRRRSIHRRTLSFAAGAQRANRGRSFPVAQACPARREASAQCRAANRLDCSWSCPSSVTRMNGTGFVV